MDTYILLPVRLYLPPLDAECQIPHDKTLTREYLGPNYDTSIEQKKFQWPSAFVLRIFYRKSR